MGEAPSRFSAVATSIIGQPARAGGHAALFSALWQRRFARPQLWMGRRSGGRPIQDIRAIGEFCRADGVLFRTDATQVVGNVSVDVEENRLTCHLLAALNGVALSTGSACTSASLEASYVLRAIGVPEALAFAALRFSLGQQNTAEEVSFVIDRVSSVIGELRDRGTSV